MEYMVQQSFPCTQGLTLPWAFVIDDLHCLYIGISKKLIGLWFDSSNKNKEFYIGKDVRNKMF